MLGMYILTYSTNYGGTRAVYDVMSAEGVAGRQGHHGGWVERRRGVVWFGF